MYGRVILWPIPTQERQTFDWDDYGKIQSKIQVFQHYKVRVYLDGMKKTERFDRISPKLMSRPMIMLQSVIIRSNEKSAVWLSGLSWRFLWFQRYISKIAVKCVILFTVNFLTIQPYWRQLTFWCTCFPRCPISPILKPNILKIWKPPKFICGTICRKVICWYWWERGIFSGLEKDS